MKKLLPALLLIFTSPFVMAFSYTMEITEQQLQEQIAASMPFTREEAFFKITVTNPVIDLIKTNNKIGLQASIKALILGSIEGTGKTNIAGSLSYNSREAAFYLRDIEIIDLHIDQIAPQHIPPIKLSVQDLLNEVLKNEPVYKLNDKKYEEELAKSMLQSIEVKEEKLFLKLGSP